MTTQELRAAIAAQGGSAPKNAKKAELELTLAQLMNCDTNTAEEEDESLLSFLFAEEAKETVATVETPVTTTANVTREWVALEEAVVLGTSFSLAYIRQFCDQYNVTNTATLLQALEGYASRARIAAIIGSASFPRFQGTEESYVRTNPRGGSQISSFAVSDSDEVTLDKLMAAIVELRNEVQKLTQTK